MGPRKFLKQPKIDATRAIVRENKSNKEIARKMTIAWNCNAGPENLTLEHDPPPPRTRRG